MKYLTLLPVVTAGLLFAVPVTSQADHKVHYSQDRDRDGHFVQKSFTVPDRRYYRGYGYYGPSYGYPYYYSRPSVSFFYNRPLYSSGGYYAPDQRSYSDGLAVDVQRELRRRGYYRGSIDGDIGAGTRAAIRAYQDDRGLAVTGRIDRALIRSLGLG
ncbi:MAG: hypothetical protein QOE70_1151 [Chthoniobacter sp.]|nr:hypothetical protein [Chthoniobacter sp.]